MKIAFPPLGRFCFTVCLAFACHHGPAVSDPADGSIADCIVIDRGDHPILACGDEQIDIRRNFDRALARIKDREALAITTTGIFNRYYHRLSAADQLRVEELSELSAILATDYPAFYGSFLRDISKTLARLGRQTSVQTAALVRAMQRFDPSVGSPSSGLAETDAFGDLLREHAGEFVVSSEPAEITALEQDPPPISSIPFVYASMRTGAFTADTGDYVDAITNFTLEEKNFCIGTNFCEYPSGWDFLSYKITLVWQSLTLSQQEIEAIVEENGYKMTLSVNGIRLPLGPPPGLGAGHEAWYAVAMQPTTDTGLFDAPYCPRNRQCVATTVFARASLKNVPLPWRFQFKVEKLIDLNPPIVIIDPESGNATSYVQGLEPYSSRSYTISPNITNDRSFFDEAIAPTFKSDRCMDCHELSTANALAEHHDMPTADFAELTGLKLEPSAYVAGAHVITCANCHSVPKTDQQGNAFEETEWKAPYVDLDVNWREKTPAQICQRVLQNLPTHAIRYQHFTEDARLFWAIEKPLVMGNMLSPKAYPKNFETFLWRTFIWSLYIENCL